jgi:S-adenosylmethionine:tRNA ribosyltransferase-isomerase
VQAADFDYDLPAERVADRPLAERSGSRLLVLDRRRESIEHALFRDLPCWFRAGDLLVWNDTKVIPARLRGRREGGGEVEILLVQAQEGAADGETWTCLARPGRRLRRGGRAAFPGDLEAEWLDGGGEEDALRRVRFRGPRAVVDVLAEHGAVPLPPYIGRAPDPSDRTRYQTIYARAPGAVAAPTAGLHFTAELIEELRRLGIEIRSLTLHVGPGTFLPVRADRLDEHRMLPEMAEIPGETVAAVMQARKEGRRVVAVGTTTVRALEGALAENASGSVRASVELFILPGYRFRWIDALITNFHLPRSTLLMLVAAFAARARILAAYREAIERGYRFYSYGDAMLIV